MDLEQGGDFCWGGEGFLVEGELDVPGLFYGDRVLWGDLEDILYFLMIFVIADTVDTLKSRILNCDFINKTNNPIQLLNFKLKMQIPDIRYTNISKLFYSGLTNPISILKPQQFSFITHSKLPFE